MEYYIIFGAYHTTLAQLVPYSSHVSGTIAKSTSENNQKTTVAQEREREREICTLQRPYLLDISEGCVFSFCVSLLISGQCTRGQRLLHFGLMSCLVCKCNNFLQVPHKNIGEAFNFLGMRRKSFQTSQHFENDLFSDLCTIGLIICRVTAVCQKGHAITQMEKATLTPNK